MVSPPAPSRQPRDKNIIKPYLLIKVHPSVQVSVLSFLAEKREVDAGTARYIPVQVIFIRHKHFPCLGNMPYLNQGHSVSGSINWLRCEGECSVTSCDSSSISGTGRNCTGLRLKSTWKVRKVSGMLCIRQQEFHGGFSIPCR